MINHRTHEPPNGCRNVTGQGDRLEFEINASIALFISRNAMQPPDESATCPRREKALFGASVVFDFLYSNRVGDVVFAPAIDFDAASQIFALNCGSDEQDFMLPEH